MSSFSLRDALDISSAADLSVPITSAVPRWQRKALQKVETRTPGKGLAGTSKTPIVRDAPSGAPLPSPPPRPFNLPLPAPL